MTPSNPFAVLRLPANATAPEIKSAGQLALARLRLSDSENTAAIREIESAIEQLRDPVKRFRFGLEWPSLGPSAAKLLATHPSISDHSLEGRQDRNTAITQLMEGETPSGKQHIGAVFMLLHAHDAFSRALATDGTSTSVPSQMEISRVTALFLTGIKQWNSATSAPEFWMAQRMRAKEINDPRVDADLVNSCEREAFAIAVESFAELASTALRLRNAQVCSAIVEGIKSSGANLSNIDGVLSEIYKPMCSRIEAAIETLQTKLKATKSQLITTYSGLLGEYVQDIQPDIVLLLAVGDLPGTTEERCRDSAAQFLRLLAVASGNMTRTYDVSKKATILAREVVDSAQIRNTLSEDSKTIDELALTSRSSNQMTPLNAQLQASLASNNLEDAIAIIDRLIVATPIDATELGELRKKVSSGLSTSLFDNALKQIKYKNIAEARRLLNSALKHETLPSQRLNIQRTLATLKGPEQKLGCLVPLALATTGIVAAAGSIAAAIAGWNPFIV